MFGIHILQPFASTPGVEHAGSHVGSGCSHPPPLDELLLELLELEDEDELELELLLEEELLELEDELLLDELEEDDELEPQF